MKITKEWFAKHSKVDGRAEVLAGQVSNDLDELLDILVFHHDMICPVKRLKSYSEEDGLHLASWLIAKILTGKEKAIFNKMSCIFGLGISLKCHFFFQERIANLPEVTLPDDPEERTAIENLPVEWGGEVDPTYAADMIQIHFSMCEKQLKKAYYASLRKLIRYGRDLIKVTEKAEKGNGED